jgi:hypothetical protein
MRDPSIAEQGMLRAIAQGLVVEALLCGRALAVFHRYQIRVDVWRRPGKPARVGVAVSLDGEIVEQDSVVVPCAT